MAERRQGGRHHRRCLGAGSAGRRRNRGLAAHRTGDGLGAARAGREYRVPAAGRTDCGLIQTLSTEYKKERFEMAIPFFKEMRIGGYLIKQKLLGRKRYPLVLMLEPLFRCNRSEE